MYENKMDHPDSATRHYYKILDGLLDGTFVQGMLLLETKLSKEYGVSRTPVRAALLRLEQEGLLRREPRGFRVRQGSAEEILEIYNVRIELERLAARLAAELRSEFDLTRFDRIIEESRSTSDAERHKKLDAEFHHLLWQSTRNGTLIDFLDRVTLKLTIYGSAMLSAPGNEETTTEEHGAVVEALRSRDAAGAEEAITQHLFRLRDLRVRAFLG